MLETHNDLPILRSQKTLHLHITIRLHGFRVFTFWKLGYCCCLEWPKKNMNQLTIFEFKQAKEQGGKQKDKRGRKEIPPVIKWNTTLYLITKQTKIPPDIQWIASFQPTLSSSLLRQLYTCMAQFFLCTNYSDLKVKIKRFHKFRIRLPLPLPLHNNWVVKKSFWWCSPLFELCHCTMGKLKKIAESGQL